MEEEKKEKTEYLIHERAHLMKEYFRNQRTLFTSLKSKILYLCWGVFRCLHDVKGVKTET